MYKCATFLDEFRDAGVGDHILDIFDSTTALRVQPRVPFPDFIMYRAGY